MAAEMQFQNMFPTEPEGADPIASPSSRLPGFVPFPADAKTAPHEVAITPRRTGCNHPRKSYYKRELARLYGCSPRTLSAWINRWPREFARTGYRKSDKQLTPRQVHLLFDLIGEPEG